MDVTKTITHEGDPARASALVQMLEQQGAHVRWTPPREERGLAADVTTVVINLVSARLAAGIAAAARQFRRRFPKATVKFEGDLTTAASWMTDTQSALRGGRPQRACTSGLHRYRGAG